MRTSLRRDAALDELCHGVANSSLSGPGLLIAVRDERGARYGAAGHADVEHGVPIRGDTLFEIGSVAKQIVAHTLTVAAGDPVWSRTLGEFVNCDHPLAGLRLDRLRDHHCGVRDYESVLAFAGSRTWDYVDQDEAVELVLRQRDDPTRRMHYSNSHYLLLAEVLRRVTGVGIEDYTSGEVFPRVGMHQARFRSRPSQLVARRARSYEPIAAGWRLADTEDATVGPHGLYAGVDDLLGWESSVASSTTDEALVRRVMDERAPLWLHGRTVRRSAGSWVCGHSGSRFGFRSSVWTDAAGVSVVVLSNRSDVQTDALADHIRRTMADGAAGPVALPAGEHRGRGEVLWVGDYWSVTTGSLWRLTRTGDGWDLSSDDGRLSFAPVGGGASLVEPTSGARLRAISGLREDANVVVEERDGFEMMRLRHIGDRDADRSRHDVQLQFRDPESGLRVAIDSGPSDAMLRVGQVAHAMVRTGTESWCGSAMSVRRSGRTLTVDLPRARNMRFELVGDDDLSAPDLGEVR